MSKPLKIGPSERQIQASLIQHLQLRGRSGCFWFAVPNEARRSPVMGKLMKNSGLRPGTPDLCFIIDGQALFLELKKFGGRLSDNQKLLKSEIEASGAIWDVAVGLDEALDRLKEWGALK